MSTSNPNIFAPVQVTTTGLTNSPTYDMNEILRIMQEFKNQPQNVLAGSTQQVVVKALSEYTTDELREELRCRAVSRLYRGDAEPEQELERLAQWCRINPDKLSQLVMLLRVPVPTCEAVWSSGLNNTIQRACGAPVLYLTEGHKYCPPCAEGYKENLAKEPRIRWSATT